MVVGVLTLEFALHGNDSLKGKRRVAQSLKMKLRNKFNVAVAETAMQESWDTLVLAAVTVSAAWGGDRGDHLQLLVTIERRSAGRTAREEFTVQWNAEATR